MCGIYGRVALTDAPLAPSEADAAAVRALSHRGPDDEGHWRGPRAFLGMRRLSVIDLTTGHQPMSNEDGSVRLVYNGEIYNYRELRGDLEGHGHRFVTHSDTEVIVHGYEQWGEGVAGRLNGMFAIALWDEAKEALWLIRDHVGVKPLYVYRDARQLVFASEIKAILCHPDVPREIHPDGLLNYLAYGHSLAPQTMYRGIEKVPPGHLVRIGRDRVTTSRWWDATPAVERLVDRDRLRA